MPMLKCSKIVVFLKLWLMFTVASTMLSCDSLSMRNDIIAQNESYTVTADSVTMGEFTAYATSDRSIETNYKSASIDSIPNVLKFRLSIGSRDIELKPAQFHYIDLDKVADSLEVKAFTADSTKLASTHQCPIPSDLSLKIDMSDVTRALKDKDYFVTPTHDTIYSQDFNEALIEMHIKVDNPALSFKTRISDEWIDDNTCDVKLDLKSILSHQSRNYNNWSLEDESLLNGMPIYTSKQPILNALYTMSLEHILSQDANQYSSLIAGECYSISLSLAYLQPKESMERLKAMVVDSIISTEYGNRSYASLTNDMMWAQAAWSVYCSTGDKGWLKYSSR